MGGKNQKFFGLENYLNKHGIDENTIQFILATIKNEKMFEIILKKKDNKSLEKLASKAVKNLFENKNNNQNGDLTEMNHKIFNLLSGFKQTFKKETEKVLTPKKFGTTLKNLNFDPEFSDFVVKHIENENLFIKMEPFGKNSNIFEAKV